MPLAVGPILAGHAVQGGDLECGVLVEIGKEAGQSLSQQGLPHARRPHQRAVVTADGRHLQRQAPHQVPPHVGEVEPEVGGGSGPAHERDAGIVRRTREHGDHLGQVVGDHHVQARQPVELGGPVRRHDQATDPCRAGGERAGQHAVRAADASVEAELAR